MEDGKAVKCTLFQKKTCWHLTTNTQNRKEQITEWELNVVGAQDVFMPPLCPILASCVLLKTNTHFSCYNISPLGFQVVFSSIAGSFICPWVVILVFFKTALMLTQQEHKSGNIELLRVHVRKSDTCCSWFTSSAAKINEAICVICSHLPQRTFYFPKVISVLLPSTENVQ